LEFDLWLENTTQPYIDSPGFTASHDLLIVAWDEDNLSTSKRCPFLYIP
jgi:hypothetical protein